MQDSLRLNTKLFGFDGIIGRRDYFLNIIYICSISLFFVLPYTCWMYAHVETLGDMFDQTKMFMQAPVLLELWFLFGTAYVCALSLSNVFRRLNDINGCVNTKMNVICSTFMAIAAFSIILPIWLSFLFLCVSFVIGLFLLFKTGKITSKYPYDFQKEFNWGAFVATWLWGLFNKSYKTLWALLLGLTPWGIYFQIYCGLKGNEWAFKNKKWTDVKKFNKSQETQTLIFVILSFVIVPLIYFLIVIGIVGLLVFSTADNVKKNPEDSKAAIEKLSNALESFGSMYFESHEITKDENKYYILDEDWSGSFSDKKDLLDMAASMAANERSKDYEAKYPNKYKSFTKTSELPRTKIYSAETGQLLGEFVMDEELMKSGSFKDIMKATFSAYRFYNPKK